MATQQSRNALNAGSAGLLRFARNDGMSPFFNGLLELFISGVCRTQVTYSYSTITTSGWSHSSR